MDPRPSLLLLQMETRKRLAKIVLVFVACFVFCWFPNHVLYLYRSFNYKEIDPSLGHMIVTLVARVLSFSNSCVNPFALYLLSESFRKRFNSQLCCRGKAYAERSTSYLLSSSAVRMTSLKSNTKNVVTSSVLINGHSMKQEIALWLEATQPTLKNIPYKLCYYYWAKAELNNFHIHTVPQLIRQGTSWLSQVQDKYFFSIEFYITPWTSILNTRNSHISSANIDLQIPSGFKALQQAIVPYLLQIPFILNHREHFHNESVIW